MAEILYDDKGEPVTVAIPGNTPDAPTAVRGFLGVAVDDGGVSRLVVCDSAGRQLAVGAAASGSPVAGNPVLIGGSDGTNARTLRTATDGTIRIDPTGTTQQPVSQGVKAALADAWPTVPTDAAGNAYDSREDAQLKRRLFVTLENETISVAQGAIPATADGVVSKRLLNGGSADLIVDGSVTPVDFTYGPGAGVSVGLNELRLFMSADNINFQGSDFGPIAALTNGIEVSVTVNSVKTVIGTLTHNEGFALVGSPGTVFYQNTGPADSLGVGILVAGITLDGDNGDIVNVKIQDDLTSVKFKFFQAQIAGVEV